MELEKDKRIVIGLWPIIGAGGYRTLFILLVEEDIYDIEVQITLASFTRDNKSMFVGGIRLSNYLSSSRNN